MPSYCGGWRGSNPRGPGGIAGAGHGIRIAQVAAPRSAAPSSPRPTGPPELRLVLIFAKTIRMCARNLCFSSAAEAGFFLRSGSSAADMSNAPEQAHHRCPQAGAAGWVIVDTYNGLFGANPDIIATHMTKSALAFVKVYISR
ncbi:hypothetical protein ACRAWG_09185 [Methylobacterium sp. P31]